MKNKIRYTGGDLDRAGDRRKNSDWVSKHLDHPESHVVPIWRNLNLIAGMPEESGDHIAGDQPEAVIFDRHEASALLDAAGEIIFLGLRENRAVFTADLSAHEENVAQDAVGRGSFIDLRQAGPVITAADAALMAYARGLVYWHRQHQFCGRCGHPTQSKDGGHMRLCSNEACARPTFPRTDPAVIMLVEDRPAPGEPPRCLLGRHAKWQPGNYSTLAGFVEPGETLEEAVSREVFEEVGVKTDNVRYQASQPWPFPASIMLGFWSSATTTEISVDEVEIEDAQWFTADELRTFGEWGDMTQPRRLPRKDSISRFLIDSWLDQARS